MDAKKKSRHLPYYTIGFAVLPAAAGSAVTFLFAFLGLAGVYEALKTKSLPRLNKYDKIIAFPALAFVLVNSLSIIRPGFQVSDFNSLVPSLLFLMPVFFLFFCRKYSHQNQFQLFLIAAPYGAFLLCPWIIYEGFILDDRMLGGAGNSIPFGMICALMLPVCIINLVLGSTRHKVLAGFAVLVFATALLLSQTRSMYIAAIPNICIAVFYLIYRSKSMILAAASLAVVLILFTAVFNNVGHSLDRIAVLKTSVEDVLSGKAIKDVSIGHRVTLFQKGICHIQDQTLWGYGIANRTKVLQSTETPSSATYEFCEKQFDPFYYSHFHNGFITAMIDAGVLGLLATLALLFSPLALVLLSPKDSLWGQRAVVGFSLTSVYIMAGLTNLLFGQDLIDAIFLITGCYLALSIDDEKHSSYSGQ